MRAILATFRKKVHEMLRSIPKTMPWGPRRSMCMSFFVKCPKQMPVQGRFKKVQTCLPSGRRVYGALEDKDMVLCTVLKQPTPVNVEGITKKDIHMLLTQCGDFNPPQAD
jgi:hypothetical protein